MAAAVAVPAIAFGSGWSCLWIAVDDAGAAVHRSGTVLEARGPMSRHVIIGLIIGSLVGGSIIIATGMWIYFSPLQTCIRSAVATQRLSQDIATVYCSQPPGR
jgi:hypothetical protein